MRRSILLVLALTLSAPMPGGAQIIPDAVPDLVLLGQQAYRGNALVTWPVESVAPSQKTADGDVSDWIGEPTRFGGTAIYSAGEYVYQDYLMDDWGADGGADFRRNEITGALNDLEPRTYRIEALSQALGQQFGAPGPAEIVSRAQYGSANVPGHLRNHADIVEARVAADDEHLHFMIRTTSMIEEDGTAMLILLDTEEGGSYPAPGGITTGAEWAFLAIGSEIVSASYQGGAVACELPCTSPWTAASNPEGYVNAMEVSIARSVLGPLPDTIGVGIATGVSEDGQTLASVKTGEAASDLINVAFRFDEPARIRMDRDQAFALLHGDIDAFLADVSLPKLLGGYTEAFEPRAGYYERIYVSDSPVNRETFSNSHHQGAFQHYGIYFPTTWSPDTVSPATWWTHYRGGHAHDAAAWVPGLIRQLGEAHGNIVISPSARGTSSWYVGRGHEDFLEVWDDSMASFPIDPDRVYMSGYSMGGYASWMLPLVYPDRFAAAFPTAGPPTQGLWDGVGLVASGANDGMAQEQLTFDIIDNALNLGYVIYHGTSDELVPVSGAIRMASQLAANNYRHRLYLFLGAEHYTNAIYDDWQDAAAYLQTFRRDPNPPRVVYVVKPSNEHAVSTVSTPSGTTLEYSFDRAYWVSGLVARDGDPLDPQTLGRIDARSFGRGFHEQIGVPEAGTALQTQPNVMTGLRWLRSTFVEPRNAFEADLQNLATAELDLGRMGLATSEAITGAVTSDGEAELRLAGAWGDAPLVTACTDAGCAPVEDANYIDGVLIVPVANGTVRLEIEPA